MPAPVVPTSYEPDGSLHPIVAVPGVFVTWTELLIGMAGAASARTQPKDASQVATLHAGTAATVNIASELVIAPSALLTTTL